MIMWIPGEAVAAFTFPGVVIHEVAHRLACDLLDVPVVKVIYFDLNSDAAGSVYHVPTSVRKNLLISIAPLFVNTLLCILFTFPLASKLYIGYKELTLLDILTGWIGFGIGYNAFPSNQDMKNVYDIAHQNDSYMKDNLYALYIFFRILNWLRKMHLSTIYAIGIAFLIPYFIFG